MQNLWDKKANNYQRFNGKASQFQKRALEILDGWGVKFEGKNIIDIGCGTGVWTLLLAQKAASVFGVDSSAGMLELLREDAAKFNILNVQTLKAAWGEFAFKNSGTKAYDIALTTMSPAVCGDDDFRVFNELAETKIYLGWKEPRSSDLLEPFFAKFGRVNKDFIATDRLEAWLKGQNIAYKSEILSETRIARRKFDEAAENICWHLEINGLKHDKNEVSAMLKELNKGEIIEEKISTLMSLIVF